MAKSENPKKEGVSVHQIENFGKNYRLEIFFSVLFILSSICSFLFFGPSWSLYALAIGGVVSTCMCKQVAKLNYSMFNFVMTQQKTTKIVIGCSTLVIAIFVAPIIYLFFGLMAGKGIHRIAKDCTKMSCCSKDDHHS